MTIAEIVYLLAGVIAGVAISVVAGMFFVGRRAPRKGRAVGGTDEGHHRAGRLSTTLRRCALGRWHLRHGRQTVRTAKETENEQRSNSILG